MAAQVPYYATGKSLTDLLANVTTYCNANTTALCEGSPYFDSGKGLWVQLIVK